MLGRLNRWLDSWSSSRRLQALLAVALPTLLALNFLDLPFSIPRLKALSGGLAILDLEFFYTADTAYRFLDAYGQEGRYLYRLGLLTIDVLLPALMGLTIAVALTLAWRRPDGRSGAFKLLPAAIVLFDYLENIAILAALHAYPERIDWVATLAGVFTLAKHLATAASLTLIVIGTASKCHRRSSWRKA